MAIAEVNIKRKSELEDITNTNTNVNKKIKQMNYHKRRKLQQQQQQQQPQPRQHRSPSPLDNQLLDDSPKKDYKSVTFDCPLLTPKDEDYYNHLDLDSSEGVASNTQFPSLGDLADNDCKHPYNDRNDLDSPYSGHPPTPPSSHEYEKQPLVENVEDVGTGTNVPDLDSNPDYIVLTSSLRLLSNNHQQILLDIEHLSGMLNDFKTCNDQEEFLKFFQKLINNDLKLPKQHKILKSPVINLNKYNVTQNATEDLTTSNEKPLFKTLNLFGKNP